VNQSRKLPRDRKRLNKSGWSIFLVFMWFNNDFLIYEVIRNHDDRDSFKSVVVTVFLTSARCSGHAQRLEPAQQL